MSTSKEPHNNTDSKSSPNSDISFILELFKYRNIAWRYLLCYCLPLQQKILIKQLRIAHNRKESLSIQRKQSLESQKKQNKPSKNIFSSLFDDTNDEKTNNINSDDEFDDDIPDFYHLPRISLNELQTLFKEGRQKYELLKKIYINEKQQAIRDEMMRVTAPPSEQYNDPSLRTRSPTITALIDRENENSAQIFSRIDLINNDWKSQEKMNKLVQLRSAPPTYSPPKPPKPLPFISKEQHRHNFHIDSRKNNRNRFNTFTAENLNITAKLNIGKNKKKKKKNSNDVFKMKVFQSKNANDNNDNAQPITKFLKMQKANASDSNIKKDMINMHRGRAKRRFSELSSQKHLLSQSQSPFAALSNPRKYIKKRNKMVPQTPPPKITNRNILSLSDMSHEIMPKKKHALTAFTSSFMPKTPPFSSTKNTLKPKSKNKIRSKSPLSMLFGGKKKKEVYKPRHSLKNPSLSLEAEDIDGLLNEQDECYSDDELNTKHFLKPVNRTLSMSQINIMTRQRSFSEGDKKYIRNDNINNKNNNNINETKSVVNLDIVDTNAFSDNKNQNNDGKQLFSGLNMLPDEDENEFELMKQLENDINKQIETDKNKIINVIESDGSDDGTLLNATIIDDDNINIISSDNDSDNINNNNDDDNDTKSLVVGAPLHKDSNGTIILNKPSNSAPPIDRTNDIQIINNGNNINDECIHQSLTQINKKDLINCDELEINMKKKIGKENVSNDSTPSSPIIIKLSNTDEVSVVEQCFSDSQKEKEAENKSTDEINHAKKHRGTIILPPEDDNNNEIETENRIAKSLEDVFNNNNTKPGLFSDGDSDEYVNINININNNKHSPSSSMEQSFGQIVINHPLLEGNDNENGNNNSHSLPNEVTPFKQSSLSHDNILKGNRNGGNDDMNINVNVNEMKESYKRQRKRGQRPNTMISGFTPHFLKNVHNVHEIEEKENKALWKQIMKDVNRTFQYRDFFRKKETRYSLGNLLYIWSRINHKIGYLQGMHDLASIVTMAIYFDYKIFNDISDDENDSINDEIQDNSTLEQLLDPKYLEHDIYAIYDALLQLTVKFFEQAVPPCKNDDIDSDTSDNDNDNDENNTAHLNRGLFDSGSNCSLYLKLHYLHHKLLKHFDLKIYTHFEGIGLSPQLYMLRWIRVIFSREFYLDQIIRLWDELFVSENLIEFIDYIVMAMIHNVRNELLLKKDMTIIAILQNYPKQNTNISSLASTARQIQKGEIQFDFVSDNKELYSQIKSSDKMRDYFQESFFLFNQTTKSNDYETFPPISIANTNNFKINENYYHYLNGPDIRIPGFGEITPTQKYLVKKIIHNNYGTKIPKNNNIRMGYLVKRGAGDQSIFARKNLKIRWFVIDKNKKMSYYKNKKSFQKNEDPLRNPIKLKGRAIRVVEAKYFCFEISGINVSKRAYLLFAKDFSDFVLWLHVLMWCADKSLYEAM